MSITAVSPNTGLTEEQTAARQKVYDLPLEQLDPGNAFGFQSQEMWWKFERLRREDPVHFTAAEHSYLGHYWSLTKWEDIMTADADHETFSAETSIVLTPPQLIKEMSRLKVNRDAKAADGTLLAEDQEAPAAPATPRSLLSMDPPDHEIHRGAVQDGVSPATLKDLEPLIRERAGAILDGLPIGEEFDWVDLVSKELTAMTLATLLDFPQEDRRKLTHWSDVTMAMPGKDSIVESHEQKSLIMAEFIQTFLTMFQERMSKEHTGADFISLMAHSPHAKDFTIGELLGDGIVLLVGGNDTTRNTITGSLYALNKWPDQFAKLRANPALIPSMVAETIRWVTPLSHMTRITTRDVEIGGKVIPKGDRVVLWYVSGNRDDAKVENPNEYIIDREKPRQHMSFGFGIHRCLGNRLAELQLRIIWEEMLARFPEIVVVAEPKYTLSNFAKGYDEMTVVIPRRN